MTKRYVAFLVQRAWDIEGYPDYFFDEKGSFYRFNRRGEVVPLKRALKRYTQGYVLKSRFYSLSQLRPLLRRHIPYELPATDHPMDF